MYKGHGGKSSGGWKKGGDRGGFDRPAMFTATCAKCNKSCEVPFKPNGKKPIYCRDCFKPDRDAEPKRFGEKRTYRSTPHAEDRGGNGNIEARLKAIEDKLDELIDVLTEEE